MLSIKHDVVIFVWDEAGKGGGSVKETLYAFTLFTANICYSTLRKMTLTKTVTYNSMVICKVNRVREQKRQTEENKAKDLFIFILSPFFSSDLYKIII